MEKICDIFFSTASNPRKRSDQPKIFRYTVLASPSKDKPAVHWVVTILLYRFISCCISFAVYCLSLCAWTFGELRDNAEQVRHINFLEVSTCTLACFNLCLWSLKIPLLLSRWSVSSVGRARCWYTGTRSPTVTPRSRVRVSHGPSGVFFSFRLKKISLPTFSFPKI